MNPEDIRKSTLDYVLSLVLRIGLFLAITFVCCGGILFLWEHGSEIIDYRIFDGVPASLRSLSHIIATLGADRSLALIQIGIILLIATPVIRVVTCLIVFAVERDLTYVVLSLFVLGVLLYANL